MLGEHAVDAGREFGGRPALAFFGRREAFVDRGAGPCTVIHAVAEAPGLIGHAVALMVVTVHQVEALEDFQGGRPAPSGGFVFEVRPKVTAVDDHKDLFRHRRNFRLRPAG